ncbi:sodium channel and clathrin linker 1-like [Biomphalaria glabrata]|uniref:Sodium channel and clathrin linker 1-like n=1 Tax=Biomphalaria glabrata TaxID=6526 RepID=A0A9W3B6B8_BIOGL|nr:sodium channel and clathrin linker 1-like [Biomphalaria glabrata]
MPRSNPVDPYLDPRKDLDIELEEVSKDQANKLSEYHAQYQTNFTDDKVNVFLHTSQLRNDIDGLKNYTQELVQENERLHQDLSDLVQKNLLSGHGAGDGDRDEVKIIQNLHQQINLALQEKEAAQDKWREALEEVDRLEATLEMEKENHQWKVVEQQANQIKAQYQESMTNLNSEMESLRVELRESHADNSELRQKVSEMKLTLGELQQQLICKAQENADSLFKESRSDSKVYELKQNMDYLNQRLLDMIHESEEVKKENASLSTRVMDLQCQLKESKMQENEAVSQLKNSVHMAETAIIEKDQWGILLKKRDEDLEQVKAVLANVINKAGERTRQEVDNVKKACNHRITQLTEELHRLEMESAEKQIRLDRLLRDKRAIEAELQQLSKDGAAEGLKYKEENQHLNKRIIEAERARDEVTLQLEKLQSHCDKLDQDNKQMKQNMQIGAKKFQDRLSQIQSEFEVISEDKINLIDKQNELNKKVSIVEQERDIAINKFNKELALVEQDHHVRFRELEIKLQTTEDSKRQTVGELRRLLTAQQRMNARWKEECQTLTHKFEATLENLRSELASVKIRNENLTSLLRESQIKTEEAEKALFLYAQNIRRMEDRVKEAELRAGDVIKQLASKKKIIERTQES